MNSKRINELRVELFKETAQESEARKRLIEAETSEQCSCRKCGEAIRCEHESGVHELVLGSCCV